LASLGQQDAEQLLGEQGGEVVIDCQFCNHRYAFDAADIAQLFAGGGSQEPSATRH
jgi:molecular chaperone Hsp33